ncbi:MAG: type II and III secretion system protein family protein [Pirellulales bacterium]|nr:type II and III secretion system protein family protein [Pirellulales bacterium]
MGNRASAQPEVIRNITKPSERLELTVNSSRILTLDKRIPRIVVNNPELITATPISANQIQLAARKPGVTQINLWDEEDQVFSVDVMIYGDVRELQHALKRLFPESSVKVVRLTNSLVLEGFVEKPEAVGPILRLAEDYAPKIVNNITVGGVQQVLLKVKVMEVSRTKLRTLGIDWAHQSGTNTNVSSSIAGLLSGGGGVTSAGTAGGETFNFAVFSGADKFSSFLKALQQNDVAKILADPTITAVSGRPAQFNVGGEFPIVVPSGLGQSTIEFKKFGTQVDFVPIVLGNGNIRLEVRPRVSELDSSRGVVLAGQNIPALRVREVDTGVELKAGQTLALAGLVQTRIEAQEQGLPFVSDLPYIGTAFRKVQEEVNEIELLILVTPEFVDGMAPHEVPQCGPGMETVSPSNCQLYFGGHLEVPACGPCSPYAGPCGPACESCNVSGSMEDEWMPLSGKHEPVTPTETMPPGARAPSQTEQTKPLLQPAGPTIDAPPAGRNDPTAWRHVPVWMTNPTPSQMPAQFSRDNSQYRTSARPSVGHTATPGLIGPLGYDVEK